jgi:hypothetical protein
VDLYSIVCVRDQAASQKWFEVFFGRPADEIIGQEYLWQVGENAWVVIDDRSMRAARVGGTMITLGVTDLDDILARLTGGTALAMTRRLAQCPGKCRLAVNSAEIRGT